MSSNKGCSLDYSHQIENGSNHTEINSHYVKDVSLGLAFFESMKKHSNRVLQYIVDTGEEDTYGDVLKRSIRAALKLKEKGIKKNDIIGICSNNHKNNLVALVATFFVGAINTNFHPKLPHKDAVHLLKLTQPIIMFVDQESVPYMEKLIEESKVESELVVFGDSETYSQFSEYLHPNSSENSFKPAEVDNTKETAVILFSSGTTGSPKGICLSHYGLLQVNSVDLGTDNVTLLYSTYYWISSHMFTLRCIAYGGARVISSSFIPQDSFKLIEKYKVKCMMLATYYAVEFLMHRRDADTSSLKYIYLGGCHIPKKLMIDLSEALPYTAIMNVYGLTETCGMVTQFDVKNPAELEIQIKKPASCGKINKRLNWKVVDPDTEEVLGSNQRGELRLKGDLIMNGFHKIDSSSVFDSQGYMKTGDLVYYDEEDCFYVVGRSTDTIRYRDWQFYPPKLEDVLMTHPAVKEAVVIGIPEPIDSEHPMGLVVLRKGYEDVTPNDLVQYVQERVSDVYRLRAGVKIIKETIKTPTGKVKRAAMRQMVKDGLI